MGGSVEEKVAAIDSYVSYCGKYEIKTNKVIHHIEVSLFPNGVGIDQERLLKLEGDRLILGTDPFLIKGQHQSAHLIWKRV